LVAVICRPFQQLADIYVVLLQCSQGFIHCCFVRAWASVEHTKRPCKEIIGVFQINTLRSTIDYILNKDHFSYFHHLRILPLSSPTPVHSPIFPPSHIYNKYKYTLTNRKVAGSILDGVIGIFH
jgi:hypothetical protein